VKREDLESLTLPADTTFEKIGEVDVESGQVLLIDPCYIKGHWKNAPFQDNRGYRHIESGQELRIGVDFTSHEEQVLGLGKSVNDLYREGALELIHDQPGDELNYQNCCLTTRQPERGGNVGSLATAISVSAGDGLYSVFVERDENGNVLRVLLDFTSDDDSEERDDALGKANTIADQIETLRERVVAAGYGNKLSDKEIAELRTEIAVLESEYHELTGESL
jgi:hypothetical protein